MTTWHEVQAALEPFGLKEIKPGQWRCNSPLRPGSNSLAFTITVSPDGEHGAYNDFVSGDTGSLFALRDALGIERTNSAPNIENTKRSYAGIDDYARAHGVSAGVFESAGWSETVRDNRPALLIPTASGERLRFLDGEKPTYKSPFNYRSVWYGLRRAVDLTIKWGQPLVICNGEASTVVAQYCGLAACCLTAGEKPSIPEYLVDELRKVYPSGKVIIAYDCDLAGREKAPKLAAQLVTLGYSAVAVDLGLDVGGDIADLCALYEADVSDIVVALPPLVNQSKPSELSRRWRIVPLNELKNMPDATWLIDGFIPEQGLSALYGGSGEGKSFFALDLAMQTARSKSVIYIAAEGELGYRKRAAAWCQHHNISESELRIAFCMGSVSLLDQADKLDFIEVLHEYRPALVIVDTVAQTMLGGDENSTRDMGLYLSACRDIMHAHSCAVTLVHHTGKGRFVERGSSALRASCDVMIRLSAEDDVIRIECSKTKDEAPFPTRYIRLLPVGESVVAIPSDKVMLSATDPLTDKQLVVLTILAMPAHLLGVSIADIETLTGFSRGSVLRALNRLIECGFADHSDRANYEITATGKTKTESSTFGSDRSDRPDRTDRSVVVSQDREIGRSDRSLQMDPIKSAESATDQTDHKTDVIDHSRNRHFQFDENIDKPADSYYRNGG